MASGDRQKILKVAADLMELGSEGAHEEVKRCSKQAIGWYIGNNAWCTTTVSVIFMKAGLKHLIYPTAQTVKMREAVIASKDHKYGIWKPYNPSNPDEKLLKSLRPGDIMQFQNSNHTCIFVSYNSNTGRFVTIEGNHSGKYSNHFTDRRKTSSRLCGFIIPNFDDSSVINSEGTSFGTDSSIININPRIYNTITELKEENINTSNRFWAFYTNTSFRDTSSNTMVPIGLNSVKNTLGADTSNIRDMSVLKTNCLGYVIGRSLEVWDSNYNSDYDIVSLYNQVSNSTKPLVYCQGTNKWYLSNKVDIIKPDAVPSQDSYSYKAYESYSKIETPFNSYFGDISSNTQNINWDRITTPEKLLIHIVKNSSNNRYNYEPAFELQDKDDVTKGFKKVLGKNIPNDKCNAKPGAIAVWVNGAVSSNSKGMVMGFVEKVKSNNKLLVSWSNPLAFFYSSWLNPYAFANGSDILSSSTSTDAKNRVNSSGFYFWGYIYPPAGVDIHQNYYFLTTGSAVMNWTTDRIWVV